MNLFIEEMVAEEHRREIQQDVQRIHLEGRILQARVYRPNWFTRAMQNLGRLLITQGERMVKRYETPEKKCQPSGHSYAH